MAISVGDAVLKILVDKAGLDQSLKETETHVKTSMEKIQGQLKAAGAAFIALGAAGLKMVDDARKMNAQLGQTALTLGISTKEMRGLALATTDVTFPLDSVAKTFDLLARAGVTNTEEMQKSAKAFDALGDATNSSADVMADLLLPAFKLFGQEIPQTSAELDKFTWLTKNSTVDLSDFGTLLTRMAPHMDKLNLSMDDAIVILKGLSEHGIQGTAATLALRTAITQAATSGESLTDILGLTESELATYRAEMERATGITDKYAEVANTQFGIMAKLKQKFSEISLAAGSFLTPLEPILGAMTALGPAMMFFSTAAGTAAIKTAAHTAALITHKMAMLASAIAIKVVTAAQWLWNAAMTANPIGLIILAIVALIAIIVLLVKNWDWVKEKALAIWGAIRNFFSGVGEAIKNIFLNMTPVGLIIKHWNTLKEAAATIWNGIKGFFSKVGDGIKSKFKSDWEETRSAISTIWDTMTANSEKFGGGFKGNILSAIEATAKGFRNFLEAMGLDTDVFIERVSNAWNQLVDFFRSIPERIKTAFSTLKDIMLSPFRLALQAIETAINWLIQQINKISFEIPDWVPLIGGKRFGFNIPEINLPAFAKGGLITEPTLFYGLRSHKPYAIAGERGAEVVSPTGAGITNTFNIAELVVREEADIYRIARELYTLQQRKMRLVGA